MRKGIWFKSKSRRAQKRTSGLEETLLQGMGTRTWSPAHQKLMSAENTRRIDPDSPEGRAIAAKYAKEGQQD